MADLGTAYVQILPEAQGIKGKISTALAPEAQAAGTMAGKTVAQNLGNSLSNIGGGMIKAGAIATAVSVPIVKGIKSAMAAYEAQNAAETKLTEIYKSRMGATAEAAKSTMKYASALQKQGVVGDEVTLAGAQQLATFAKMPQTVDSLLPAMQNLLVQQKGLNGTQQDATQIANLMGKVMMGQTGALKRVGVSFTEAEEKVLKYGTEQEKAAMLAQVITNNVGEMNKAMLDTPEGKIQQMKNSMGDLAEQIGATLAPALASIANWISANLIPKLETLMAKIQSNPIIGKIVVGIAGLLAAGGPLLIMLGMVTKGLGSIMSAAGGAGGSVGGLGTVFRMLTGPVGIVVGLFTAMFASSEEFRGAVIGLAKTIGSTLTNVIKSLAPTMQQLMGVISQVVQTVAASLVPVIKQLTPVIATVISALGKIVSTISSSLVPIIQALLPIITSILTTVTNVMQSILSTVVPIVQRIVAVVVPVVQRILSVVTTVLGKIASVVGPILNKVATVFRTVWNKIGGVVRGAVNGIKTVIGGVSSVVGKVTSTFNRVKDAIQKPIEKVRDKVKGIVEKIKGFFHFSVPKPNIPTPHFGISPSGWKLSDLMKGKIPKLSLKWYAEGGIMTGPTLFGGGEAGHEAILPLDPFWRRMDAMADKMENGQSVVNNFNITVDGSKSAMEIVDQIFNEVQVRTRMA